MRANVHIVAKFVFFAGLVWLLLAVVNEAEWGTVGIAFAVMFAGLLVAGATE